MKSLDALALQKGQHVETRYPNRNNPPRRGLVVDVLTGSVSSSGVLVVVRLEDRGEVSLDPFWIENGNP